MIRGISAWKRQAILALLGAAVMLHVSRVQQVGLALVLWTSFFLVLFAPPPRCGE